MKSNDWRNQINIISGMLASYGYNVCEYTDAVDQVDLESKSVHINSRKHAESRFYTLLHELGHVDIYENSADEFESNHPVYVQAVCGQTYHSKAGRVSLLAEEIQAWKKGRIFAREADLYIDDAKYNQHMTEAIISYINWAATQ